MSEPAHSPLLELAGQAARKAGALLRTRHNAGSGDVVSSVGRDIKLESDKAAEALILGILKTHGAIPILTEESGAHGSVDSADELWIVDPLDGSMNFNRGIPLVCVSIALWRNGKPHLGVVYDFVRDELFMADAGQGAWLNGSRIHVSAATAAATGVLMTGFPSKALMNDEAMAHFNARVRSFKKVRMLGAAALMLSWVACGRVDAYTEDDIMFWDVAAGLALVEAAGGWIAYRPGSGKWQYHVKAAATDSLFPGDIAK